MFSRSSLISANIVCDIIIAICFYFRKYKLKHRGKGKRSPGDRTGAKDTIGTDMAIQTRPSCSRFTRGIQTRPVWSSQSSLEDGPIVRILRESNKIMKRKTTEEDDDELAYGQHVASQLRQLPKIARQSLRIRIEQLFLQEMDRQTTVNDQSDILSRLEQRYTKRRSQISTGSRLSLLGNLVLGIDLPPPRERSESSGHRDRAYSTGSPTNVHGTAENGGSPEARALMPVEAMVESSRSDIHHTPTDGPDSTTEDRPRSYQIEGHVPGELVVSTAHITLSSPSSNEEELATHVAERNENTDNKEPARKEDCRAMGDYQPDVPVLGGSRVSGISVRSSRSTRSRKDSNRGRSDSNSESNLHKTPSCHL